MKHASLFSGIGGFDLATQWMGWENIFQVEIDGFCQKVLEKNFPNVKRYGDIKQFDGTTYRGTIDVLSGGFPCQPFSKAGEQKGRDDDRFIWPEMFRVIKEVRPCWVIAENVVGIIEVALDQVCTDLEGEDYEVQTIIIPACAVDAPHTRSRIWVVANSNSKGLERIHHTRNGIGMQLPESNLRQEWKAEPGMDRVALGVPNRVDRIKSLGNAIVPQVAYEIFKAIENIEKGSAKIAQPDLEQSEIEKQSSNK